MFTFTNKQSDFRTEYGFSHLYERNAKKLFLICFKQISNREDAEEIVHDIFKSVWERRDKIYDDGGSVDKYLVRSIKFKIIDYYRKKSNQEALHTGCSLENICGGEHCTENHLEFVELQTKVSSLVDQLPCMCRNVYKLSREKGLSNKEIASSLLISEKTVESHITKALTFLKKSLVNSGSILLLLINFF